MELTESPIGMWAEYIGVRDETLEKQETSHSPHRMCQMEEVLDGIGNPVAVRFHSMTFSFVVEGDDGITVGFPIQQLTMRERKEEATRMLSELRRRLSGEKEPPDFHSLILADGGDCDPLDE